MSVLAKLEDQLQQATLHAIINLKINSLNSATVKMHFETGKWTKFVQKLHYILLDNAIPQNNKNCMKQLFATIKYHSNDRLHKKIKHQLRNKI